MNRLIFGRLITTVILTVLVCGAGSGVEIPGSGVDRAVIVLGKKATKPEAHAARELRGFIEQVTGARLRIVNFAQKSPMILVGEDAARMVDRRFSVEGLGTDGIVVRTVGRNLILAGGKPRGTLYAVYTFLEDYVGCRWWAPGASTIPVKHRLQFDHIDLRYVPQFEYREPYWYTAFNRDWAVRNKALGTRIPLDEEAGGKPAISHIHHSFYQLIPPDKYFRDHPEWFGEVDGVRKWQGTQLCLSNEAMRKQLVQNVLAMLRKQPKRTNVSVAQNDGSGPCRCAECLAVDKEEGSTAGIMMRFVNAVAADVEKEFPNVVISTFAYTYSQSPPRITCPRNNVIVWLCTMNASYNLPLNASRRNEGFARDLRGWSKLTDRLYIWDYVTNFRHYLFIHPNLRVLGPNIRFFADNSVKGVFEQGAGETPGAEMMELRAWVIAKLLWNPRLSDDKLITEFLDGYYGPAGKPIRAYIDLIHDVNQKMRQPLGCYEEPNRRFMDPVILAAAWHYMKDAERVVAGKRELMKRVRAAQMPLMYAYMVRWNDMRAQARAQNIEWPVGEDPHAMLADYKARAAEIGITHASELEKFDKLEEKLNLPK